MTRPALRRASRGLRLLAIAGLMTASVSSIARSLPGTAGTFQGSSSASPRPWTYGGGPEQIRYSALAQIDRTNVKQLQVAWTYDTRETGAMQTQPIVAHDVLY